MLQGGNKQDAVQRSPGWHARSLLLKLEAFDLSMDAVSLSRDAVSRRPVKDSNGWV